MKKLRVLFIFLISSMFINAGSAQSNGALDFDAGFNPQYVADYVTVSGINASTFPGFTIEAWIYLKSYNGGTLTGSYVFGKEGPDCTDPYGSFVLLVTSTNHSWGSYKLDFGLDPGGIHTALVSNNIISLNQWHHVAATWDGSFMKIYIDGELEGSKSVIGPIHGFDSDMHIGNWTTCVGKRGFVGTIDEARVWSVGRTQQQLRETMYNELTGTETGLYAYYKFNEVSGQTAFDSGPNSLDGYLGSANGAIDENDPTWVSSTSPLPYYTVQNGDWNTNSVWATGQFVPSADWAKVKIKHNIILNVNDTIGDLEIDAAGGLTIDAGNQLSVSGILTNNSGVDGLIINSDAMGTGSLIESSGGVDGKVNRFLSQNKWHFIGIPVNSATASVFYLNGNSNIYLRTHVESNNSWDNWITNVNANLVLGRGYECWVDDDINQDETIQFQGVLNSGDYTSGVDGFYDLQYTSGRGLNLISNPYPSALSADIQTWTKTNIANSVWTWSDDFGNYVYWNGVDTIGAGSGFGSMDGGVIPAMQGFFVLATDASPSITIPQSSRTHNDQIFYKNSENLVNTLELEVEGNGYKDVAFIRFDEKATNDIDVDYDVQKLFGLDEAPQLFFEALNEKLSVIALPEFSNSMIINMGFECGVGGVFTIYPSDIAMAFPGSEIFLEDVKEEVLHNFSEKSGYSFIYDPNEVNDRFRLHINNSNPNDIDTENGIHIRFFDNSVYVEIDNETSANLKIINLQGQEVVSGISFTGNTNINLNSLQGFYLVQVITENSTQSEKIIIR